VSVRSVDTNTKVVPRRLSAHHRGALATQQGAHLVRVRRSLAVRLQGLWEQSSWARVSKCVERGKQHSARGPWHSRLACPVMQRPWVTGKVATGEGKGCQLRLGAPPLS
jgi:hypothetical protein